MKYHDPYKKNGTITTKVVCAVCFIIFTFLWLYEFQADVIAIAQHTLSKGVTHYNRTAGAFIITGVLYVLQLAVAAFTGLSRRTHALTYLPSMLLLAFISDVNTDIDEHYSLGAWCWGAPLALAVWGGLVWLARRMSPYENDDKMPLGIFSKRVWVNMLQMAVMMLLVALIGNTNAVFHYSARAEMALMENDVDEALRVGSKSLETNKRLTMLRIYALSKKGQLGEKLFSYPVVGTSEDMLPMHVSLQILSADSIWKHLGAIPSRTCENEVYYKALERDSLATWAVADYRLCGCLIDRRLDAFVDLLPHYYEVSDSLPLPRHYQEALVLYRHLRTNPAIVYQNAVIDEDWDDMKQLEAEYPVPSERKYRVYDRYRDSYWYYFFYEK